LTEDAKRDMFHAIRAVKRQCEQIVTRRFAEDFVVSYVNLAFQRMLARICRCARMSPSRLAGSSRNIVTPAAYTSRTFRP